MISRMEGGLILAASIQDLDDNELIKYKDIAKRLFKRLNDQSETRCSLITGPFIFHYIIQYGIVYLCLCEPSYPRALAFSYLEDIQKEFQQQYGDEIGQASRPYQFMKFDIFIEKLRKQYRDTRAQKNLNRLNEELKQVSSIMTTNIEKVLERGTRLEDMTAMSDQLFGSAKAYYGQAKTLNLQAFYGKWGPIVIVSLVVVTLLYIKFKWF
jgi:vesicle transport protein SEC22